MLNADVFLETCLAGKIVSTIRSHSRSPSSQRLWKRAGEAEKARTCFLLEHHFDHIQNDQAFDANA